ncbi:alpha/beta hydrolase-fold protein [Subtercola sp. YIM 133946]|uniref:alpha/beta hydrolase-fold protein n=1 Tax=Subtercola sp. YIM 133946 TaxID=3118909 RepID=UPI002F91E96B
MPDFILTMNIVEGPVIITFVLLSLALIVYLLVRRPTVIWLLSALVGVLAGACIALLTVFLTDQVWDLFGTQFLPETTTWIVLTFSAVGLAVASMFGARWWRRVIAGVAIVVFVLTGTLGVNASIGITKTIAALIGIDTSKPLDVPDANGTHPSTPAPSGPLYQSWNPPSTMPSEGTVGSIDIPNTNSGFDARKALAYVPPAGLVQGAPTLPVIIQLNGLPGSPGLDDPKQILDKLASNNKGLAPIVINPDQLGSSTTDPLCLDVTSYGKVETYIMKDVVPYVKAHFNVSQDPKDWTILGFSNGGECAAYFGAKYPSVFGNIVDISGDEYPGVDDKSVVKKYFDGDQSAYEATWPAKIFAKGSYPDTTAVFTVGALDTEAGPGVQRTYDAAVKAGVNATFTEIAGAGHDGSALDAGLLAGYDALYPRLGLSKGTP